MDGLGVRGEEGQDCVWIGTEDVVSWEAEFLEGLEMLLDVFWGLLEEIKNSVWMGVEDVVSWEA